MRKTLAVSFAFVALSLTAAATPSGATTLSFQGTFSGPINDPNGLFNALLGFTPSTGDVATATLIYSPTATPLAGPFAFGSTDAWIGAGTDFVLQAAINGTSFAPFDDFRVVGISDNVGGADSWDVSVNLTGPAAHRLTMNFTLWDSTASFTDDPSVFRLPEPLGAFDSASLNFYDAGAGTFLNVANATGSVPVPEPATLSLLAVGLLALGLSRKTKRT